MTNSKPIVAQNDHAKIRQEADGCYVVSFTHRNILAEDTTESIGELLKGFIDDKSPGAAKRTLILDLTDVDHLNSSLIGVMISLHSKLNMRGDGKLTIVGANDEIIGGLKITQLNRMFQIYGVLADAVAAATPKGAGR